MTFSCAGAILTSTELSPARNSKIREPTCIRYTESLNTSFGVCLMYRSLFYSFILLSFVVCGCAEQPAAAPENGLAMVQDPKAAQDDAKDDETISKKMASLVDQAKENTPSLDDAKKWLSDAGDATGQTADDTMKWVNETYKSLSENGMTSAKNAKDWVTEDWNSINAWEYKVVSVSMADVVENPELLEQTLNANGNHRWDCFHVSESSEMTRFFMKRHKKSYLKNVPLKDMLKLIPLLDAANGQ